MPKLTKTKQPPPRPRRGEHEISFLTQEELRRLLAAIKDKRDRAIFLTAYRWHLMNKYAEAAGVPKAKWKFHSLKHSIATHLLDADADLTFVKD